GLKVLEIIEEDGLCSRANEIGDLFNTRLTALQEKLPNVIGNVRNLGAMIAMELVEDGDANKPNAALTGKLVQTAAENGLILLSCGIRGNVIRFLPALTAPMDVLNEGLDILENTLKELTK
ncbi:MAG: aminotransferase class III-fold pyridoxal phosphate-dependent enzyme, partial [Alphaproteobacteria bacterium]|nr:aminotransferase class III-fold pyridoxal phosphate-dependent enzyme [Alphaproteobacteria bacterium]